MGGIVFKVKENIKYISSVLTYKDLREILTYDAFKTPHTTIWLYGEQIVILVLGAGLEPAQP